jgi:hypothetical protein
MWYIMVSFLKFGEMNLFLILVVTMRNEVVRDQLILFHKPNKNSEKMVDEFISQTKHLIKHQPVVN